MTPRAAVCPQCGDAFTAKSADRVYCYGKWCTQAAYQKRRSAGTGLLMGAHAVTCDECGTEFIGKHPSARWCSKQCANRHWGRVRSRRRTALSATAYTDLEIFERDKWRCHLCGKKVSKSADRKAPTGATIDHLLPIALGGRDEPANVACAHNQCNREKRTRAMNEQLAII